ncbi:MAG: peptide transporter [Kiritimatiellaeota bacterium]|nr:peptide transporter [Kiritimatiellota bacterium]
MSDRYREDKELQEFRNLMHPPEVFEDGFGVKTIVGALFLAFFMVPGSMYLQLIIGQGLGPAARWVTVILFAEVAKRSLRNLRQQEVYILFYMTGITLATPFWGLLWRQYLVQSPAAMAMGIAQGIPSWVAPQAEIIREQGRTFFTRYWVGPIALMALMFVITRIDNFGLGYVLYRLTNDVEKLPFPMAPVGAQGVLALAESKETGTRWRWRVFSIGGVMGLTFGFFYVGIPALTGAFLAHPVQLIPIPWMDLTNVTQNIFPATPVNLVFSLGLVITGMVLPFWAVIGGALAFVIKLALNPALYHAGVLTTWRPGMQVVDTLFSNNIDFYLSFGIGITFSICAYSILQIVLPLLRGRRRRTAAVGSGPPSFRTALSILRKGNPRRGDIPIWVALGIYLFSTVSYLAISTWLVPGFPWWFFLGYGFIYTPLISYATAKLEGLAGQAVSIPLVREAAFILSGYKGVAIWFAPIPLHDYGRSVRGFRVVELTGTKLSSVIKTEIVVIPIVLISTICFSHYIWKLAPIPSDHYPFTQKIWELQALNTCLLMSSTMAGSSIFFEALKPLVVSIGFGIGLGMFLLLSTLGLPTLLMYGFVRGLGSALPGAVIPELMGALIGRYYLLKRFGKQWRQYAPVLLAGYGCGMGLVAMASVAIALIAKSVSMLSY